MAKIVPITKHSQTNHKRRGEVNGVIVFPDGREKVTSKTEWEARRRRVFYRDEGRCQIEWKGVKCMRPLSLQNFTVDHRVPCGAGGSTRDDRESNLRTACFRCNSEKGSRRI